MKISSSPFEPVTSQCWCNTLTNLAMQPLMLGAGQLCVYVPVIEMNVIDIYEIR